MPVVAESANFSAFVLFKKVVGGINVFVAAVILPLLSTVITGIANALPYVPVVTPEIDRVVAVPILVTSPVKLVLGLFVKSV
jgi:hypothetical protein